jgi:hypothetical protein
MSDWNDLYVPNDDSQLFFASHSFEHVGLTMRQADAVTAPASTTWVANLAIYYPFVLPYPYMVQRFFWINGATLTGPPNLDIGIFAPDGRKLVSSGNTAQSGTSSVQFANASTPTRLSAGAYWMGVSSSGSTALLFCWGAASVGAMRGCGYMQQATANPLPATATFATLTNALAPYVGFTRTASGF